MRAGLTTGGKDIRVETVPDPEPGEEQVLVRVEAAGICGSDLHNYHAETPRRYAPRIQGHEMAGEIVALGPGVLTRRVGDRVAVEPILPCLRCDYCLQGRYQICPSLKHRAGGFAELLAADERNAHPLPDGVASDHGAMAEVYAVAVHATNRVPIEPGEKVAVIGSGPIGLTIAEMANLCGAGEVMVVGRTAPPSRRTRDRAGRPGEPAALCGGVPPAAQRHGGGGDGKGAGIEVRVPLRLSTASPFQLLENSRISYSLILGQHQHLGDHFGRFWIVVGEGQEQPPSLL